MNILYIGQYSEGTTSKMRADELKNIFEQQNKNVTFNIIDTHVPFFEVNKIWRTIGFRYKIGKLISLTNKYILNELHNFNNIIYDIIWIDKAIFIKPQTTQILKKNTKNLVHFTPDPAFTFHKSKLFLKSLKYYNKVITTKSYELEYYNKYCEKNNIILITQGYDIKLHKPIYNFNKKYNGLLFIGHYEQERGEVIKKILKAKINVYIAGIKWKKFINKNKSEYLNYMGIGIYGEDYVNMLSKYYFSWGSISKWIPELHTTRTFEIPACGTALITERNPETLSFFNENEAIFYDNIDEMVEKILYYQDNLDKLQKLTQLGTERVRKDGRDYSSILKYVIDKI